MNRTDWNRPEVYGVRARVTKPHTYTSRAAAAAAISQCNQLLAQVQDYRLCLPARYGEALALLIVTQEIHSFFMLFRRKQ